MPTAPDEVWAIALKVYVPFLTSLIAQCHQAIGPKAEKWRTKSFPLYDNILMIVDGIIATGENTFRAGRDDPTLRNNSFEAFLATAEDDGALADEEDNHSNSQDLTAFLSTQRPVKHGAQAAPDLSQPIKRQRSTSAAGFLCLCGALETLALSVAGPSSAPAHLETTPERRARAIAIVENHEELSDEEWLGAFDLFSEKPEIADSFVAIKKPALRMKFLRGKLEKNRW
jgi:hypothetical protein